jgi:hypothetical protein
VSVPACANMIVRIGPEELGGFGDLRAKIEERVAGGEDLIEAANKVSYFGLLRSQCVETTTKLRNPADLVQSGRQGSRSARPSSDV